MNLISSLLVFFLLGQASVYADNSQTNHPIRVEMTANDSRFRQTADVEKLVSRIMVAFNTGLHLEDIRLRRVGRLEGASFGMEIWANGKHLGTYRVDERPESTKAVLLVYPK